MNDKNKYWNERKGIEEIICSMLEDKRLKVCDNGLYIDCDECKKKKQAILSWYNKKHTAEVKKMLAELREKIEEHKFKNNGLDEVIEVDLIEYKLSELEGNI